MNKAALYFCILALTLAPLTALALTESNITDEPTVSKPQPPAAKAPAAKPAPAEQPAADAVKPEPAPAQDAVPKTGNAYQPSAPAGSSSSGAWTPGGSQDTPKETAPSSSSSEGGRIFDMPEATQVQKSTYSRKEVDDQVMGFFEGGARGLADLISRCFERFGEPSGFIKGNEGAGALVVGLRYGEGWLYLKNGKKAYVYWQSPSVGFDLGVNASKVFCLVYNMTDPSEIYQRFPSVDGSAYVVGGFGMNFQRSGDVTLAPIRFGVGLRLGVNAGYMGFTKARTINPF